MKGSSLFAFSGKDQKSKGEHDDTKQKEEDDKKYENEESDDGFGHTLFPQGFIRNPFLIYS
jgi:hypothetical protein